MEPQARERTAVDAVRQAEAVVRQLQNEIDNELPAELTEIQAGLDVSACF